MTTPSASAVLPPVPQSAPAAGTRLPPQFPTCFGCGTDHPTGLWLETDYRLPVPVGSRLHLAAECTGVDGRKIWARGEARLGGPDGPLALTAAALFVAVPLEHFGEHGHPDLTRKHPLDAPVFGP